jgi:23S rRNA U2552 (ribose-2'-O)-methylase RlmE/FtsJ
MDPIIDLASHHTTSHSLIQLTYLTSELSNMNQPVNMDSVVAVDVGELSEIDNRLIYSSIIDIIDGINLPKINNRAENKLRNLLAICPNLRSKQFKSSWTVGDMLNYDDLNWNVLDVAAGPGSWSAVMLNRFPSCRVTGYTLYHKKARFRWYSFLLRHPRFTAIYGDLIIDSRNPASRSKLIPYNHFDLCICDGGDYLEGETDMEIKMMDKLRLLAAQLLTCLRCGMIGSHAVVKLFRIDNVNTQHLVNLMGCAYERFTVIKTVTSRSMSNECFLICLNRRVEVEQVIEQLNHYLRVDTRPEVMLDPNVSQELRLTGELILQQYHHSIKQALLLYDKLNKFSNRVEMFNYINYCKTSNREWVVEDRKDVNIEILKILLSIR